MFKYELPGFGIRSKTHLDEHGQLKFDPPVYEQRYAATIGILEDKCWNTKFKKIVDFGCAEMHLLPLLRRIEGVQHILEVDIDANILQQHSQRARPLMSDYLSKRKEPLRIEVLEGSITAAVEQLRDVDVVIGLEIIEHLHAPVLMKVPENVFGFIQPKLAIFSTPNADFNRLFNLTLPNGFRHPDHKFEWSRKEFKQWTMEIIARYPNYSVAKLGVGKALPNNKHLGHVSQIAIFARNDILPDKQLAVPLVKDMPADPNPDVQYKEVYAVDYPKDIDERTTEQKIVHEAQYVGYQFKSERFLNRERGIYQLPLSLIAKRFEEGDCQVTIAQVRAVLQENNFDVDDQYMMLPEYDEEDEHLRVFHDDLYDPDYDALYNGSLEEQVEEVLKRDEADEEDWD